MIRRPPRSTLDRSSAASDVYKRQSTPRFGVQAIRAATLSPLTMPVTAITISGLTFQPVSYTHLRAHETVLDLVCRLLLEKKKKQKTDHTLTIHYYPSHTTNTTTQH